MKLSLGPILYYWPEEVIRDFYRQVASLPVDTVYLGETICSKRRALSFSQWFELAHQLRDAGKEVVLSTLALLEAESELKTLKRVCENGEFLVEANDLAAVNLCQQQQIPFVLGHSVNLYNQGTLQVMADAGMRRWVMPLELSRDTLAALQQARPAGIETELFVWGKMPLAYAARCYTARHHELPKDDCQYRCLDDPDGMLLYTQEQQPFLTINGIQTQSARHCNLLTEWDEMVALGVDVVRISPQSQRIPEIVAQFDQVRHGALSPQSGSQQLERYLPFAGVNGYWMGAAGIERLDHGRNGQP